VPSRPTPSSRPKVLVLTAGFGEGHNAAARAVVAACDEIQGPGTATLADLFALTSPRLNEISRQAYLRVINGMPRFWSRAYAWMDRSTLLPRTFSWLGRDLRKLAQLVREDGPGVICSTYPVYAFLVEKLRRESLVDVPHFNVVTDSISINSLWWRAGCSGWFVPNEDTASVMRAAGVDASRLCVSGFPVDPVFNNRSPGDSPPDIAAAGRARVLVIVNSGSRAAASIARKLLVEDTWEVTCAVGRDDGLRRELQAVADLRRNPATILGWTREMPRLMMTHHVVVSKAGGATTQEAIAAGCPMIVTQVVPGQEEGNYELMRRHSAGLLATTPGEVAGALRRCFANEGAVLRAWRSGVAGLAHPGAARTIATRLLAVAGESQPMPATEAALQP